MRRRISRRGEPHLRIFTQPMELTTMFDKKNTIRLILLPLLFLPALVLAQGMSSNLVLLKVNDGESALEYNASGSNHGRCVSGPGNGCVRVTGRGDITFRLVSDRRCSSGASWELTAVQLGGENAGGKGTWGNLSPTAAGDFGADASSGYISTGRGNSISVRDDNSAAYSLWYRVSAECDGRTIWFDPRLENDGTGGR